VIKNVYWALCEVPVIPDRFSGNLNFLDKFLKNTRIKFKENPSSGSRVVPCGRTDRRTDVSKPIAFRSFANAPINLTFGLHTL
jgi:hypothetical protein